MEYNKTIRSPLPLGIRPLVVGQPQVQKASPGQVQGLFQLVQERHIVRRSSQA